MPDPTRKPRYITPETLMEVRFGEGARPQWDVGVLCFRGPGGCAALVRALGARPVREKAFYAIDETLEPSDVHELTLGGRRIVLVSRCLWGGPQTAILVEELAALEVQIVIGYGVAGSLAADLPKGTQIVAATGIVTDGTSRAYTPLGEVAADPGLMTTLSAAAAGLGIELRPVRVATVDALYQETADDVRGWLARGAHAINMETAPLYAAAEVCKMRSVWLGHISDSLSLDGVVWESWQRPAAMTDVTVAVTAALLTRL